ncbi:MAG: hypothetical protein HYR56_16980 [Acidobacteria bacterium]|nr:hypothetical protein [Acidobacteriota bacterium]MBI3428006.1 hypothetical protein [Acidobacteriota bacterium]
MQTEMTSTTNPSVAQARALRPVYEQFTQATVALLSDPATPAIVRDYAIEAAVSIGNEFGFLGGESTADAERCLRSAFGSIS